MECTLTLPSYPKEIEDWWWDHAIQKWPEHGEEKIYNLIRREIVIQSDRFNKKRYFEPQEYGSRDLSLITYGNFFFPRTWHAMSLSVIEAYAFRGWEKPRKGPVRILDIGSGLGASGLSAIHQLKSLEINNEITLDAWDYSGKSLNLLKSIHRECNHLWNGSKVNTRRIDLRNHLPFDRRERFDLILLGYSMNEIFENFELGEQLEWIRQLTKMLSRSGFMIIVEPAKKDICDGLHTMASLLSGEKDLLIQAPYFNGKPCPFLNKKNNYYSHEVRKIRSSNRIEKINGPLRLETHQVKFGLSILSRQHPKVYPENSSYCRMVSPMRKKKGTLSFIGVGGDGLEYIYEIQKRDLSTDQVKSLTKLERGDILKMQDGKIGKDEQRIRIPEFKSISCEFSTRWEIRPAT
jgi:SAM-dependent methyltransferase